MLGRILLDSPSRVGAKPTRGKGQDFSEKRKGGLSVISVMEVTVLSDRSLDPRLGQSGDGRPS